MGWDLDVQVMKNKINARFKPKKKMSDQHQTCSLWQEHISGGNILEALKKQI